MITLELDNAGAEVANFGSDARDVYTVVDEKGAGLRDRVTGVRWDRGRGNFLSELEAAEGVFVE